MKFVSGKDARFKDITKAKSFVNPPGIKYNTINEWQGKVDPKK